MYIYADHPNCFPQIRYLVSIRSIGFQWGATWLVCFPVPRPEYQVHFVHDASTGLPSRHANLANVSGLADDDFTRNVIHITSEIS